MTRTSITVIALGAILFITACEGTTSTAEPTDGSTSTAPAPAVDATIGATEFSFQMPDIVPAGEVTLRYENIGGQPHFFEALQVDHIPTEAEIQAALEAEDEPEWILGPVSGASFGLLSPGEGSTATATLEAGTYMFLCFMPDAEGTPHAMLGMAQPFTVEGEPAGIAPPEPDVNVTVGKDGWVLPDLTGLTGEVTFALTGEAGASKHSFEVGRMLDDSITDPKQIDKAFQQWLGGGYAGEAPVSLLGGLFAVGEDETRTFTVMLETGERYLFHDEASAANDEFVVAG